MTDESGRHFQRTYDGLGRLTGVMEPGSGNPSPTVETDYAYNPLGDLLTVTQRGASGDVARVRSFAYDSESRLLTATNPETGTICYGVWSSGNCVNGYDANSNLLSKTDARGITVSYKYDGLSRLTARVPPTARLPTLISMTEAMGTTKPTPRAG
jgi:YD repeat-containing protein